MIPREAASADDSTAAAIWVEPAGNGHATESVRFQARAGGVPADCFEIARVLAREGRDALIDLDGRQRWARIAIPPPAAVAAGDFVVVAGRDSEWWAVGTLGDPWEATDAPAAEFDGKADIKVHAPRGRISLAAQRIWLGGESVSIVAKALHATATSCVLQCQTVNQWIAGLVSQTVGRLYQGVTGDYHHHSHSIVERAEGQVTIKGDRIHLN